MDVIFGAAIFISGYIFANKVIFCRYSLAREGYRLYFTVGFWGIVILIFSGVILFICDERFSVISEICKIINNQYQENNCNLISKKDVIIITLSITSIFFSLFLPFLFNSLILFIDLFIKHKKIQDYNFLDAIKDNDIEKILYRSAKNTIPVALSLNNGKEYVGNVIRTRNVNNKGDSDSIRILPMLSGYRDAIDKRVYYNQNYTKYYDFIREKKKIDSEINPEFKSKVKKLTVRVKLFNFIINIIKINNEETTIRIPFSIKLPRKFFSKISTKLFKELSEIKEVNKKRESKYNELLKKYWDLELINDISLDNIFEGDFEVVIPIKEIITYKLFDALVYKFMNQNKNNSE